MKRYLARRLVLLLVSLIGCLLVIFVVLRLLPGDPANALLGPDSTAEQIAAARARVGSDQPVGIQLVTWLQAMARLDFGTSFTSNRPVLDEIGRRFTVTLPLTLIAFGLSTLLAAVVGFVSARYARRWYGSALSGLSQLGVAIPAFWVGIVLVWIFALWARLAPAGGFPGTGWDDPGLALRALTLPVVAIVLGGQAAVLTRYVRSATLDVLSSDYLRTARSLGASLPAAFWRHGLRNACVPVINLLAIEFATTLVGAAVIESVFSLPGLGSLLVQSIAKHDYPSIQGVVVVSSVIVLGAGFLADVVQRLVDPRLTSSQAGGRLP